MARLARYVVPGASKALRIAAAAAIGGTASEISGGKFANGAVTGAFSRAFNDENHDSLAEEMKQWIHDQKQALYWGTLEASQKMLELWSYAFSGIVPEAAAAKAIPLNPAAARAVVGRFLARAPLMPRQYLEKWLSTAGFRKVFEGKGMQHWTRSKVKLRLDPPQGKTQYHHMHVEVGGQSFDAGLKPVGSTSPAAHIPVSAP